MTHICVSKLTIIGSDNGLSPGLRQAKISTNAWILLNRTLGSSFSEILSDIHAFSFKKIYLKMSSAKWWQFCLGLNVLNKLFCESPLYTHYISVSINYQDHWASAFLYKYRKRCLQTDGQTEGRTGWIHYISIHLQWSEVLKSSDFIHSEWKDTDIRKYIQNDDNLCRHWQLKKKFLSRCF